MQHSFDDERFFAIDVSGNAMAPLIPDGSRNIFVVGVTGCYLGRTVLLESYEPVSNTVRHSVGIYRVISNTNDTLCSKTAIVSSYDEAQEHLTLARGYYRIVAEWVQLYTALALPDDVRCAQALTAMRDGNHANVEWPSLSPECLAQLAGEAAVPAAAFGRFPAVVRANRTLAHLSMVNFPDFAMWTLSDSRCPDPVGLPREWITRGRRFQEWYDAVISPFFMSQRHM
jgi:hypothetical protein